MTEVQSSPQEERLVVDPKKEQELTKLFQKFSIANVGERRMSDREPITPLIAVEQRRKSFKKPSLMDASKEVVLLTLLEERQSQPSPLSQVDFANVIAGWTQCYGWNPIQVAAS